MVDNIKKRIPFAAPILCYLGVSWLVLQVAGLFAANGVIPPQAFNVAFIILAICFPLMCAFAVFASVTLKPLYADEQIKHVKCAKKDVCVLAHSFDKPPSKYAKSREIDEATREASAIGVNVRTITPGGPERAQSIYEARELYGMNIKIAEQLEDQDLRFTLIDDNIVIISYQKVPAKKLSRKYATIKSQRLSKLLRGYFDEVWSNGNTMGYEQYIAELMKGFGITDEAASFQRCADRLGIPVNSLKRIWESVSR